MVAPKSYVGVRFGKLVAVEKLTGPGKRTAYRCICDCGQEKIALYTSLYGKHTRSCGCLRSESSIFREARKKHPTHGPVFTYYKKNARDRGLEWGITREHFTALITSKCHYCSAEPKPHKYGPKVFIFNGIDRLHNDSGYSQGNVVPCCSTCNRAKLDMTLTDFREWNRAISGFIQRDAA